MNTSTQMCKILKYDSCGASLLESLKVTSYAGFIGSENFILVTQLISETN